MHLHRPYRRFLPCRRFSWPPSCNLDIWIDSDRWIKFQEFQYRKTTQALCRFTGTIAQSGFPQHSHSGLVRVYQSTHFYKNAGFKSVQLEQIPFLPFQRQLGSQVWLHWHCTDHGAIFVRCHPFGSLVGSSGTSKVSHGGDLSSAP